MKYISILGSTGEVGKSVLNVARRMPHMCEVVCLANNENIEELRKQINEFSPTMVSVFKEDLSKQIRKEFPTLMVSFGMEGLREAALFPKSNMVFNCIGGSNAILPSFDVLSSGRDLCLASKEVLVSGGELLIEISKCTGSRLIPIDSEQSAVWQSLLGENIDDVNRIILTASGGPFLKWSTSDLRKATFEDAKNHPTWKMGEEIAVNSATMMNKVFEIIGTKYLFGCSDEQISVIVHPQSVVQSMVEFRDGSTKCMMANPNIELYIQYAMSSPSRLMGMDPVDLCRYAKLEFFSPDFVKFPCLELATRVLKLGESYPCFLRSTNEVIVERFCSGELDWGLVFHKLDNLVSQHQPVSMGDVNSVLYVDKIGREAARCA